MRRHPLAQMLGIGAVAAVAGTALVLWMDWFPAPAAGAADRIDTLYDALLIASVPIFVLVMTIAIYSVVKFRARPGDARDGAPIHGNTRLELLWVAIPFAIVTGLAVYAWIVLDDIEAGKPDELVVNVTGQQFTWTFEYPAEKVKSSELVLPKDRPVKFNIRTRDVIHSFWVPEFRLKSDAVPGITTNVRLTPTRLGRWQVVCAELCGIGHATMRQTVRVLPRGEFGPWLERQRRAAGTGGGGGGGEAASGEQVFTEAGCGQCHALSKAGTNATVGPGLDDLAEVAGERRPGASAEEYVRESITDPDAFTVEGFPRGVMPGDFEQRLSRAQLDALVEYLLEPGGGKGS